LPLDKHLNVRYNVRYMQQIISITELRNNLASLVKQVAQTKESVVIVQDSNPIARITPYEKTKKYNSDEYLKKLLSIRGTVDLREENKAIRKEIEKRLSRNGL